MFGYVRERSTTALHAGNSGHLLFAHQPIRTPLAISCKVAVMDVVAGEALVALSVVVIEDGEGKAGEGGPCVPHRALTRWRR